MRFLVDNAISPLVVLSLREAGHDAVHIRDLGLQQAKDTDILARAASEDRVLISTDKHFGTLLVLHPETKPSLSFSGVP